MFIGHFGVGFGAKALAPRTSLGSLFLAAQFIDLLWPPLLLAGVERVRIAPGWTRVTPLDFEHYPVSHSLLCRDRMGSDVCLGVLVCFPPAGCSRLGAGSCESLAARRGCSPSGLPLYPGSSYQVGLGLWSSTAGTLAVELPAFACGLWLYLRATVASDAIGRWAAWGLVGYLLSIYIANLFGSPPPSVTALAWVGQAQWLLIASGYWIDRHRLAEAVVARSVLASVKTV